MEKLQKDLPLRIDFLSTVLPTDVYLNLLEMKFPREPLIEAINHGVEKMSLEERQHTLQRIQEVKEYAEIVEHAIQRISVHRRRS